MTVSTVIKKSKNKISIELDKNQLERLMASLGLLSKEIIESIDRAEKDFNAGRYRILRNLKDLLQK